MLVDLTYSKLFGEALTLEGKINNRGERSCRRGLGKPRWCQIRSAFRHDGDGWSIYNPTVRSHRPFTLGQATRLRDGSDGTIIACGQMVYRALGAAELLAGDGLDIRVLNMSTIKPLDGDAITAAARETGRIVTAEEHSVIGGLGSAVAEHLATTHPAPMAMAGVQDTFGESGTPAELFEKYGLSEEAIAEKMVRLCRA